MDHHCPWVGNCVGIHNHKYFLNFLFNAMAGCLTVAITMIYTYCTESLRKFDKNTNNSVVIMLSSALVFSLSGLLGLHSYLIVTNKSTLEMEQLSGGNPFNRTKEVDVVGGLTREKTDYEANVEDVLGKNHRYWCWPFEPSGGLDNCNGIDWQMSSIQ